MAVQHIDPLGRHVLVCGAELSRGRGICRVRAIYANGRCRWHGGLSTGAPLQHGRWSKSLPPSLVPIYDEFKADPNILDLKPEIAQIRAWWHRFQAPLREMDATAVSAEYVEEMRKFGDCVARLASIAHKIEFGEQYTIHIEGLQAVIAQITDIIARHVPSESTRAAIAEEIRNLGSKLSPSKR